MNPRLVAIAGPLVGAVVQLREPEIWIGRDPVSQVYLSDPLVSRKHCLLKQDGDSFELSDQDSSNGTLVNNLPVRRRRLQHGDQVKIGDSVLVFLSNEQDTPPPSIPVSLFEGNVVARTTLVLSREEAMYLHPAKVAALPASEQVQRDLNTLLTVATELSQLKQLTAVQQRLLELIFAVIPAEFGVIWLSKERFQPAPKLVWLDRQGRTERPRVSQTIIERVLHEGQSLLSNDVGEDQQYANIHSLVRERTRSLLVVPLQLQEQVIGVIYLDSKSEGQAFNRWHQELLSGIAGPAAQALDNARQFENLENETRRLHAEIHREHALVGESAPMQQVYQLISKVAKADSSVLILGESGTGKELAARAIHQQSARTERPFIAINCAGLTDTLMESDLFGHEKGAFTGAVALKKGKLELAQGGTLFLDELGEMPLHIQAKLLRVLQFREFERLGGTRPIKADLRLIAATNRDLNAMVAAKTFRQDLYYRLNVVTLTLPPLRERPADIVLLAQYFALKYGDKCKRPVKGLAEATRRLLQSYEWPGNVRELENAIERAVVLGSTELLLPEDLPEVLHEMQLPIEQVPTKYHGAIRDAKVQQVLVAVEQAQGNITKAATTLGIHPNNLHRLIRNLGIRHLVNKGR